MIKKIILSLLFCFFCINCELVVHADPMDPLNGITQETTESGTGGEGEAILPNLPEAELVEITTEDASSEKLQTAEEWEEENKHNLAIKFLDSALAIIGQIGFVLPTLFMGIYLLARMFPTLGLPIFNFITRGKVNIEEFPWYLMFIRTIPVAVLGLWTATGQIKLFFRFIWNFVEQHFLN